MANQTISRYQTSLVIAGRVRTTEPFIGDMWAALNPVLSDAAWNALGGTYNDLEDFVHTTITGGFTVTGADYAGNPVNIDDDPNHPRPIHK